MKKILLAGMCAVMAAVTLASCSGGNKNDIWDWESEPKAEGRGVTLNVYNWGEYISDGSEGSLDVNAAFTHITGIDVNYKMFDTNESMYALISAGAADYDVIIPSDYMIGKMANEGLLAELNFDNIPNFKYIDPQFRNMSYDPENKYTVPYLWGTVCIFYNKTMVDEADLDQGWDLLWNEKYSGNILMFDNQRDAFAIALKKLGYSMNTTNKAELDEAAAELKKQKPLLQGYVMDQIYDKMGNDEAALGPYYAGDASIMATENENIGFLIPEEGTNKFVDAMCIPKSSEHKAEAEEYINFMCRTEIALANAGFVCYATPHTEAKKLLNPEISENPIYYPSNEVLDKAELFIAYPDEINKYMDSLWMDLKK